MVNKTKEWLEAHKIKTSLTEPDQIVPDYPTQLKAAEMVRQDWGLGQTLINIENKLEFNKVDFILDEDQTSQGTV